MNIVKKYTSINLVVRIVIGLGLGILLGVFAPNLGGISLLGNIFVGALKAIAPVLVFVLVTSSLSKANGGIGQRFRSVIFLYILSTLLAAIVAVVASFIYPVTMTLQSTTSESTPPSGIVEVFENLLNNLVTNPISSIANANYIGILFWAIIFGLALRGLASKETINVISNISDAVSKVVGWIIQCAPFGIFGLVYSAIAENGLDIFGEYGKLLIVLVCSMLVVILVVDPLIVFIFLKKNPYPLVFTCIKESGVTAFFTRSSAANIPVNMQLCKKLGIEEDFYSVSIPLGATINMNGAAITITVMSLATCNTLGVSVDIPTAIILSVLATVGACGASGVSGGSLLLIPMACSLFGISNDIAMQAVAVGFIIGVIQDSLETALNSSGDVIFCATAEYHDRMKKGEEVPY